MSGRTPDIMHYPDIAEMNAAAAMELARIVHERVYAQGVSSVVLAGGSTPRQLYELLAREPYRNELPWESMHVFWGDERFVAHDHEYSNYRMVRETLLDHVPIPKEHIHPVNTACANTADAARDYETHIRSFFTKFRIEPSFDLVLLGVGADGHTASLFPGDAALDEPERWVMPVTAPSDVTPTERITLTRNVLNSARYVLFLTARHGKEVVLSAIERGQTPYPASLITGRSTTHFFIADSV